MRHAASFMRIIWDLLRSMGAELVAFSPVHDGHLPDNLDGLLLYGGYPELNGKALEENLSMRQKKRNCGSHKGWNALSCRMRWVHVFSTKAWKGSGLGNSMKWQALFRVRYGAHPD